MTKSHARPAGMHRERRRGRSALGVASLLLCWHGWLGTLRAGPLETLRDVALHPSEPQTFAAVYTEAGGGLLITRDGGASFGLVCNAAIEGQPNLGALLSIASFTADGHLLVASFEGLFRGGADGCGFQRVPTLGDAFVADLVRDPEASAVHYALTSSGGRDNGVYRSTDQGVSWAPLGSLEPSYFRQLVIAPRKGAGRRFYLGVAVPAGNGSSLHHVVRVSEDEGASFVEQLWPGVIDLRLLGVDRADPELLYASARFPERAGDELFVNDQAGASAGWRALFQVGQAGSFVALAGGGFALVDAQRHELWRFRSEGSPPERIASVPNLSCVAASADLDESFVCSTWTLQQGSLERFDAAREVLDLNRVSDLVSCADDSVRARCAEALQFGWCGVTHYPDAPVCPPPTRSAPAPAVVRDDPDEASHDAAASDPEDAPGSRSDGCALSWASKRWAPRASSASTQAPRLWLLVLAALLAQRRRARVAPRLRAPTAARPPRSSGARARALPRRARCARSRPEACACRMAAHRSASGTGCCALERMAPRVSAPNRGRWAVRLQARCCLRAARPARRTRPPGSTPCPAPPRHRASRGSTSRRSRVCRGPPDRSTRSCRSGQAWRRPDTEIGTHRRPRWTLARC